MATLDDQIKGPRPEEDIHHRFSFHPATAKTGPQHDEVRTRFEALAQTLARNLPPGRETSMVLTKLEEAMFWANAAIARHSGG